MPASNFKLPAAVLAATLTGSTAGAFYFPTLPGLPMAITPPAVIQPGVESPQLMEVVNPPVLLTPPADLLDTQTVVPDPDLVPESDESSPPSPPDVPEPATVALAGVGLAALLLKRRAAKS